MKAPAPTSPAKLSTPMILILQFPGILHAWPCSRPSCSRARTPPRCLARDAGARRRRDPDRLRCSRRRRLRRQSPRRAAVSRPRSHVHSQPVAWVLGETLEAARLGAARVAVEYRPLAAHSHDRGCDRARKAFIPDRSASAAATRPRDRAQPASISRRTLHRRPGAFLSRNPMRHRAARRDRAASRSIPPRSIPAKRRRSSRACSASPRNQVTVQCLRMGGAFGGKEVQANPWAAIAALGAWKTKRPVRVRLPRRSTWRSPANAILFLRVFAAGFDDDGRLRGVRSRALFRRRLEPRSLRPGALARAVSLRQRLSAFPRSTPAG